MHRIAAVLAVLATLVLAAAATVRGTLLDRHYYQGVLDHEHTYTRLYDQVLPDPEVAERTRGLLGGPVAEAVLTSNLKTVLPPATTREIVDEQIRSALDYLHGDRDELRLNVDLRPVLANLGGLGARYFGMLVATAQHRTTADYHRFLSGLDDALRDIAAGRRPTAVPTIRLDEAGVRTAARVLLFPLPKHRRDQLRPAVLTALRGGDAASALAAVGPFLIGQRADGPGRELAAITSGGRWNALPQLRHAGADLTALQTARSFTRLGLGLVQIVAAGLGCAALAALWITGRGGAPRRLRTLGLTLACGGAVGAAAVAGVRLFAGRVMIDPPADWPGSVVRLIDDVQHEAVRRLLAAGLLACAVPLAAGLVLAAGAWLWRHLAERSAGRRPDGGADGVSAGPRAVRRRLLSRPSRIRAAAAGTAALALLGTAAVPATVADRGGADPCNGSAALCGRRYDQVAYLATHNSMSSSADRFIIPLQDPDIIGQLDAGARALLIDSHTWETRDQISDRLRLSDFGTRMQNQLTRLLGKADPRRPGLWLCHAVCGAGAVPLVDTLRRLKQWMRDNPREVVTLDIEDDISGEQTRRAFHRAGLDDLLYTPDPDPARPWPTLGRMIASGRRLVVFAEKRDGPAPWYRNLYRYAMETPYAFASPDAMSCAPNRGGTGKRLFLMNHFVTVGSGSRLDAGRVNARAFLLHRAHRCEHQRHHPVNFVAVDYMTIGDAKGAVDALNAERLRHR